MSQKCILDSMAFLAIFAFEPEKYFGFDGRESEIESKIESEMFCAYTLFNVLLTMFQV